MNCRSSQGSSAILRPILLLLSLLVVVPEADAAKVWGHVYNGTCGSQGVTHNKCARLRFVPDNPPQQEDYQAVPLEAAFYEGYYEVEIPATWSGKLVADDFSCTPDIVGFRVGGTSQPCINAPEYSFTMSTTDIQIDVWAPQAPMKRIYGLVRACGEILEFPNEPTVYATGECFSTFRSATAGDYWFDVPCGWYGRIHINDWPYSPWKYHQVLIDKDNPIVEDVTINLVGGYKTTPQPTLLAPVAGTDFEIGSVMHIDWEGHADVTETRVHLLRPGSQPVLLATVPGNASGFDWTVAGPIGSNCQISILSYYDPVCYFDPVTVAVTSGAFDIVQAFAVTSPAEGVLWPIASEQNITWTACGDCGYTGFRVLVNDGLGWDLVGDFSAGTRSVPWEVLGVPTTSAQVKVIALNGTIHAATALSPLFAMDCFIAQLSQPTAGTHAKQIGSTLHFGAAPVGTPCSPITTYEYSFSRNGGQSWTVVGSNGTGYHTWTITGPPSTNCKARIKAWNDYESQMMFSQTFAIANGTPPPLPEEGSFASVPLRTRLVSAAPNPFRPNTVIHFEIGKPARTKIEIVDVKGQRVRTVDFGVMEPQARSWTWDGRNDSGKRVGSAIYFARLVAGEEQDLLRIIKVE